MFRQKRNSLERLQITAIASCTPPSPLDCCGPPLTSGHDTQFGQTSLRDGFNLTYPPREKAPNKACIIPKNLMKTKFSVSLRSFGKSTERPPTGRCRLRSGALNPRAFTPKLQPGSWFPKKFGGGVRPDPTEKCRLRSSLSQYFPDNPKIQGNRTSVPPPREWHPFRGHPLA